MATAVRISFLDSGGSPTANLDFSQQEITNVDVRPLVASVQKRTQKGNTVIFMQGATGSNPFHSVNVDFRIHGNGTVGKLITLRTHLINGGTVRVHPVWQDDDTIYYDCNADPDIIAGSFFSGYNKGGDRESITFFETNQSSKVTVSGEIIVVT